MHGATRILCTVGTFCPRGKHAPKIRKLTNLLHFGIHKAENLLLHCFLFSAYGEGGKFTYNSWPEIHREISTYCIFCASLCCCSSICFEIADAPPPAACKKVLEYKILFHWLIFVCNTHPFTFLIITAQELKRKDRCFGAGCCEVLVHAFLCVFFYLKVFKNCTRGVNALKCHAIRRF